MNTLAAEVAWTSGVWNLWVAYQDTHNTADLAFLDATEDAGQTLKVGLVTEAQNLVTAVGPGIIAHAQQIATANTAFIEVVAQVQYDQGVAEAHAGVVAVVGAPLEAFADLSPISIGGVTFWQAVKDGVGSASKYVWYGGLARDYIDLSTGIANGLTGGIYGFIGEKTGLYDFLQVDTGSGFYMAGTIVGTVALTYVSFGVGFGATFGLQGVALWSLRGAIFATDVFNGIPSAIDIYNGRGRKGDKYIKLMRRPSFLGDRVGGRWI